MRIYKHISVYFCIIVSVHALTVIWMAPRVSPHSNLQVNASTSLGALALAIETVYNESILPTGTLNVIWLDSACSSKQSIGVLTDFIFNSSVDVIVGPPCTQAMIPIAQLASYRDIAVFQWLGNEESLDDKTELDTLIMSIPPLSALGMYPAMPPLSALGMYPAIPPLSALGMYPAIPPLSALDMYLAIPPLSL
ncbi:guanylate cyclase 2G-like [Pecten maximus]|uniref:guanylate cyclase 2G-like n=1 Tax=Pecten maximus TaxID=6579 RepID=UPI001458D677|nr:guanylate cyclase 2G-like [Pecten maximus]